MCTESDVRKELTRLINFREKARKAGKTCTKDDYQKLMLEVNRKDFNPVHKRYMEDRLRDGMDIAPSIFVLEATAHFKSGAHALDEVSTKRLRSAYTRRRAQLRKGCIVDLTKEQGKSSLRLAQGRHATSFLQGEHADWVKSRIIQTNDTATETWNKFIERFKLEVDDLEADFIKKAKRCISNWVQNLRKKPIQIDGSDSSSERNASEADTSSEEEEEDAQSNESDVSDKDSDEMRSLSGDENEGGNSNGARLKRKMPISCKRSRTKTRKV